MVKPARVRASLLGTFRVERNGEPIHPGRRKAETLFAYLVLFPEIHTRDQLAALLWGDYAQARKNHEEALGNKRGVGMVLGNLADVEASSGNPTGALDLYTQSLQTLREVGDRRTGLNCLIGAAGLIVETDAPRAVRLGGAITKHLFTCPPGWTSASRHT